MRRAAILVAVAVGGALGTVARYEVSQVESLGSSRCPWATFLVNVVGAFVLGAALTALVTGGVGAALLRSFMGIGFCGGRTPFSPWRGESGPLAWDGDTGVAVLYLGAMLVAGFVAVLAGVVLTRRML